MHQETLLYMWHRLPFDQKRAAAPATRPPSSGRRRRTNGSRLPGGCATLGVDRAVDSDSAGTTSSRRHPSPSCRVCDRAPRRDQRALSRVRRVAGGYRRTRWWTPEDWRVGADGAASRIRSSGSARRRAGCGAAMFDRVRAAAVLAGLCQPGRSVAHRARGAARACRPRPNSSAPRYGSPDGPSARYPWGDAEPTTARRRVRFHELGSRAGRQPSSRTRAPGASRILVGNGWEWTDARRSRRFPASARWRAIRNTSTRFLRRSSTSS